MNYQETLQFLYAQVPVFEHVGGNAYKPGLQNIEAMDEYFNHPHRLFKTIHVAGTNGKGSVSHTLAAMLQAEGHRVGLFTSPHLLDFSERIRVNGTPISEEFVVKWTACHFDRLKHVQPSFFELATMMAFCYFAAEQVDVAVIEVGLGGRLDSTNIITPELCVITNISLDHTQFLGATLPLIAREKAGIMKPGVPCVVGEAGEADVREVFVRHATEVGAPLTFAEDVPEVLTVDDDIVTHHGMLYHTRNHGTLTGTLTGACQPKNANTILCAVDLLPEGLRVSPASVRRGMAEVTTMTGLMGRWQLLRTEPETYCDTGHNEGCFVYIEQQLKALTCKQHRKLHIVFGMMRDKDVKAVVKHLPTDATYYITAAGTPRSMSAEELAQLLSEVGITGKVYPHVTEALQAASAEALRGNAAGDAVHTVFIGGSNFVVAEAMLAMK